MQEQELLKQAEEIQRGAVDYIARTQPIVQEYEALKQAFAKKAHQTVGALVERHIVSKADSTALIEKLASDPVSALDLALSVSRRVGVGDGLGKAAKLASASGAAAYDPFERLVLFGDARADVSNFDGGSVDY